jgi:hypothetical protein
MLFFSIFSRLIVELIQYHYFQLETRTFQILQWIFFSPRKSWTLVPSEQLTELQLKFNVTDAKLFDLENQLYTIVRSESNLKEELGFYKWKLAQVEKTHGLLQANYTGLELKFNKTNGYFFHLENHGPLYQ